MQIYIHYISRVYSFSQSLTSGSRHGASFSYTIWWYSLSSLQGVGYLLNVHEGPNSFRWRKTPGQSDEGILEAGMVTTDEPGIYLEGNYGIRIENELLCKKADKNEYGQFMEFEIITYAPIDLDAILPEQMTLFERRLLNEYHQMVYEKLAPCLEPEVRDGKDVQMGTAAAI